MQIMIEMDETGTGTMSIDGSEPQPFGDVEEVCSVIERLAGQPDADEMEAEQAGMDQGFAGVRGGGM